jgi:broad specificity phosphatase PhoE
VEIVLVRHASTAWSGRRYCGRSDPPLTRAGLREAAELAGQLAPTLPRDTRIVSSPSRRAVATATALAAAMDREATVETDERWLETDFGLAEGRRFDDLAADLPELAEAILAGTASIDWPSGETAAAIEARIRAAWQDLVRDGRHAVVVTHAGPLLHALALARGLPPDLASIPSPGTAVRIEVPGAGVPRRPVLGSRP